METVKDYAGNDITVYANRIEEELYTYFSQFIPEEEQVKRSAIDQYITESPQNRFNAALMHIGKTVFNDKRSLKLEPYTITEGTTIKTNNNKYNYDMLNDIADIFINICYRFNKRVSLIGYSYLVNIDYNMVSQWNNQDSKIAVSAEGFKIYQKLFKASEESLSSMLAGRANPVGIIAMLNHWHNWTTQHIQYDSAPRRVLSAEELPRLDNMHNDSKAIEDQDKS